MGYYLANDVMHGPERMAADSPVTPKTHTPVPRLQSLGFRYDNPALGRWLSRDPLEEDGGANLFGFVRNSPCLLVDPLGARVYVIRRNLDFLKPGMDRRLRLALAAGSVLSSPVTLASGGLLSAAAVDQFVADTLGYYNRETWHCLIAVAPSCSAEVDNSGQLVGFAGIDPDLTWDFNDGGYQHPAKDWKKDAPTPLARFSNFKRWAIDEVSSDDSHDQAVIDAATAAASTTTAKSYKMVGNNCCDWASRILRTAALSYENPNPRPFGPRQPPEDIKWAVVEWLFR